MTVHFIGAGPGAADLLTLRGRDLIARCPVCLYAGSLVPVGVLQHCPPGARIVDTAPLSLDAIIAEMQAAEDAGLDVARLHSGDLSIWSAVGEQTRRLERLKIPFTLTPGVPSFAAAAAALGRELTLPEVAQSLVLTRTSGRASAMPSSESLSAFAATRATADHGALGCPLTCQRADFSRRDAGFLLRPLRRLRELVVHLAQDVGLELVEADRLLREKAERARF